MVIVTPAPNSGLTIEQIAAKDVPAGKSYQIVDEANIPLPDPAAVLQAKRATATIKRGPFLRAIKALGVVDAETAKTAASGAWPPAFDAFTAGLSDDDQIDAIATWADGDEIRRMNSILLQIQAFVNADPNLPDVTDEQLDAAFGIIEDHL